MRKFINGVLIFLCATGILLSVLIAAGTVFLVTRFEREFPETYLTLGEEYRPSLLYASDGDRNDLNSFHEVAELHGSQISIPVTLDEVPAHLIHAFVAIEDKHFFTHDGVDWLRTGKAVAGYLFGKGEFGASSITQQLVKNLTGNDARTPARKLQELFYATDLEEKTDKTEILERYLNIINLSGGCAGVGAAAERYYSVPVGELTLSECASIAAITKNPSRYDPLRHPENNRRRRDTVLDEMCRQGYISEAERDGAKAEPLATRPTLLTGRESVNSWYTDTVIEDVLADLTETYGYTSSAASRMLYYGGLRIYTAMDPEIQSLLSEYYLEADGDVRCFPPAGNGKAPQSSCVMMDPHTGDLLAVVGARGEKTANRIRNHATATRRPPASALKPLSVYAPALRSGKITWASVYDDVPVEFYPSGARFRAWPKNADGTWRGLTGIPDAVSRSVNTVAVRVLREIGKDASATFLTGELGLPGFSPSDGEAALALGQMAEGLTLRELTAAYTTFADGGLVHSARSYYLVTDREGKVLLSNRESPRRVLSEGQAAIMTRLLTGVTQTGTARSLTLTRKMEIAGKTGTSSSDLDRWFIGYTPDLLCGVWYGFEYPEDDISGTAGNPAVAVWDGFMTRLLGKYPQKLPTRTFSMPEDVLELSYCADSGGLVTDLCLSDPRGHRTRTGWFLSGTEPQELCRTHTAVMIDPETGGVTEDGGGRRVGLLHVIRSFPMQIYVNDAPFCTRDLPEGVAFCTDPTLPFFANALGEDEFAGIGYGEKQYNRGCPTRVTEEEETLPPEKETETPVPEEPEESTPFDGGLRNPFFPESETSSVPEKRPNGFPDGTAPAETDDGTSGILPDPWEREMYPHPFRDTSPGSRRFPAKRRSGRATG